MSTGLILTLVCLGILGASGLLGLLSLRGINQLDRLYHGPDRVQDRRP
jgi:hypothetical protein